MTQMLIQTELVAGSSHMIVWLPVDKRVRVGTVISLEDDDTCWTVLNQYQRVDRADIKRGWNNNI